MGSLRKTVGFADAKRTRISITEIRSNILNGWQMSDIESLANNIALRGQLEPITVYEQVSEDGKRYTVVSGHRRFLAISLLHDQQRGNGMINVIVVPKPSNDQQEEIAIIDAYNSYRHKSREEIEACIRRAIDYWNYLASIGKEPKLEPGSRKTDWIGNYVGLKGRQVRNYLKDMSDREKANKQHENEMSLEDIIKRKNKVVKNSKGTISKINQIKDDLHFLQDTEPYDLSSELSELQAIQSQLLDVLTRVNEKLEQ